MIFQNQRKCGAAFMHGWRNGWLLLGFLALLLTGCTAVARTAPDPQPQQEAPAVQEPTPVPAPMVEPEPEPEPELQPGPVVTVDGTRLSGGSVWNEDVLYVRLQELVQALGAELSWNPQTGGGSFLWKREAVCLAQTAEAFKWGNRVFSLPAKPMEAGGGIYVPVYALCQGLGLGMLEDTQWPHLYITPAAGDWSVPEGYRVPVMMYHGVTDNTWGASELFVSPSDMEAQLQYLVDNGYETIWFEDLSRIDQIEKPVLLTFDDGYADNYLELFPLLQKYHVKATIFVVTGTIDYNSKNLTSDQIREMVDSGLVSIQSHTVTHPYLGNLTREAQEEELTQSQLALARITGQIPYVLCYPSGNSNQITWELAREYYRFGIDMNGGSYYTGQDPYRVNRWYVPRGTSLAGFAAMIG